MRRSSAYIFLALVSAGLPLYYFCNNDGYSTATTRPTGYYGGYHSWGFGRSSSSSSDSISSSTSRGGFGSTAGAHASS